MKNKFLSAEVNKVFQGNDILAISETHFNIRSKCPNDFFLIGRSKPLKSQKPRGGVAMYVKKNAGINIECLKINLTDCIAAEIIESNVIIVVMYIPPNNSPYYMDEYFDNVKIIFDTFGKSRSIYLVGDLNSRVYNSFPYNGYRYKTNPDATVNQNGRSLIKLLEEYDQMNVVNGMIKDNIICDSN